MTRQEQLDRKRYYGLLWFLVGYTVWQGGRIVQELWPSLNASAFTVVVTGIALVGWGLFTYQLVRLLLLKRAMTDRERRQMNDERVQQNRRRSFVVGFWAMLGTAGLALLAPSVLTVTAAANLTLLVGVGAAGSAFLYLESDGVASNPNDISAEVAHE